MSGRPTKFTEEQWEKAEVLYGECMESLEVVSQKLGMSSETLRTGLKKRGIEIRTPIRARLLSDFNRGVTRRESRDKPPKRNCMECKNELEPKKMDGQFICAKCQLGIDN